jgi:hypothetical protein
MESNSSNYVHNTKNSNFIGVVDYLEEPTRLL